MRYCILILAALTALTTALTAAASPARGDGPRRQQVHMELVFLWRNLPVWRLVVDARIEGGRYTVRATSRAVGAVWLVTRSLSTSSVEGRAAGGRFQPTRYVLSGSFRGRKRRVEITYPTPGRAVLRISPPDALKDWSPVPEALRRGTADPLTALVAALAAQSASPCGIRQEIYDGHRRYRITATRSGEDRLTRSLWSRYEGPAARCTVRSRTLAGFHQDGEAAKAKAAGKPPPPTPPGTVWIAPVPGTGIRLPVKMRVETRWGEVRGELFKYRVTAE